MEKRNGLFNEWKLRCESECTDYFQTAHLDVGYEKKPIVRDVTLTLKKGEILTLIGPNGAGKTTILKSLIRQLKPLAGTVVLNGRELFEMDERELAKRLSVVLTGRPDPELMTCEEVVETGRYPYTGSLGILSDADRAIVSQSMCAVRAEELKNQPFAAVSDGQRQRIMLARALCQEPELLILDEPTSYLDLRYKLEFLSILQKMSRERSLTVILSLHELDLAERISDHIACIRDGALDRFGTPEEIFSGSYITELFSLSEGSYQAKTGQAELPRAEGTPRVFVLAGGGCGTPVFRRLQRLGIPFAAGILMENDLDYPAACSLAVRVISVPAFSSITEEKLIEAQELIRSCDAVIRALPEIEREEENPFYLTLKQLGKNAVRLDELLRER